MIPCHRARCVALAVLALRDAVAFVPRGTQPLTALRSGGTRISVVTQAHRRPLRMLVEDTGKSGGAAPPMPLPARPRSIESEQLALEAERLQLQAEKLRLEAERGKLMLEEERLQRKGLLQDKQDKLLRCFQDAFYGADGAAAADAGDKVALTESVRLRLSRIDSALFLRLAERAEMEEVPAEREKLWALSEEIMRAVTAEDAALGEKLSEQLRESVRRAGVKALPAAGVASAIAMPQAPAMPGVPSAGEEEGQMGAGKASQRELVERWMRATMTGNNTSAAAGGMPTVLDLSQLANGSMVMGSGGGQIMLLPLWVPTSLLRHVSAAPPLDDADVERVKAEVFGMETFYVTGVEKSPVAVLFRGNLRGESDAMFDQVTERLNSIPELAGRVQLFLMRDPSPAAPDQMDRQENRPVFILTSKEAAPGRQAKVLALVFATTAFAATCFSAFAYSIGTFALNADFFKKVTEGDVAVASQALPVAVGVVVLQLLHELAHAFAAKQNGLKLGPPVFIPSLQVGSFGAITPFLNFPKSRKAMFDVAAAGPVVGATLSFIALVAGLAMTGMATQEAITGFPVVPAVLFHSSMLVGAIVSAALPSVMAQAITTPIPIHPLAIIGITGIIVNALNLMPIGRLDGGRAATAVFGRRTAAILGTATLLLQAVSAVFNNYSLQLFWGLVVILFQRVQDVPALDEVTGVDDTRTSAMLALTGFAILALLPFPNLS